MNRLLLVLFGLMLLYPSVQAQDLLVTHAGDSINSAPQKPLPYFSIGVSLGYSHRTIARYNPGAFFDVDFTRYIGEKRRHGIGLRYSFSYSAGGTSYYNEYQHNGQIYRNSFHSYSFEDISTIGAFGSYRLKGNRHCLIFRYGLGLMLYDSNSSGTYFTEGTAFGVFGDIGYSFRITKHLSLGVKVGHAGGMLTKLRVEDNSGNYRRIYYEKLSKDNRVILDHLKVGVDLRFDI